jgi:hypothetical protein
LAKLWRAANNSFLRSGAGSDYITVVLDADDRYDSTRTVRAEGIAAH